MGPFEIVARYGAFNIFQEKDIHGSQIGRSRSAREKIVPEYVVAGVSKRSQAKKFIKIKKYTLYKKYIKFNFDYDIAIVKLAEKVKFSKKIQPIPLPEQDAEVPTGSIVTAAGWGRTENITESDHLLEISTKIADRQTCESFAPGQITDRMICAENIAEKKSTCSGDSGGPLVYNGTLIGVVSWGDELCREYIGVYTNVGYFSTWIKKKGGL
ncbi:trypsin-7-like [Diabrotica undecimpunctata]|uniref:trypsin-7-like n=1 Tax=Diabrotica undecimpunctata TaxID=50387 RepID=UPI003B635AAF